MEEKKEKKDDGREEFEKFSVRTTEIFEGNLDQLAIDRLASLAAIRKGKKEVK